MSSGFDPYHEWLGIDPREHPVDHYRLLGLPRFETDAAQIAAAADERMAVVRRYQSGQRRTYTQRLLTELSAARVCLLDLQAKTTYDAALVRHLEQFEALSQTIDAPRPAAAGSPQQAPSASTAIAAQPAETSALHGRQARQRAAGRWTLLLSCAVLGTAALAAGWFLVGHRLRPPAAPPDRQTKTVAETAAPVPAVATPQPQRRAAVPTANGELLLTLEDAELLGGVQRDIVASAEGLTHWEGDQARAVWDFHTARPGYFRAELTYAMNADVEDAELELRIDDRTKSCSLRSTASRDEFVTDEVTIAVLKSGLHTLTLRVRGPTAGDWLTLRSVRFMPLRAAAQP